MPERSRHAPSDLRLVLVVDDDEVVRLYVTSILEKAGFQVITAGCADDALRVVGAGGVDLVLLDKQLPGRSGLEVLAELRLRRRSLPVILLTGTADLDQRIEGLERGADDYLAKPAAPGELVARVRAQLRAHDAAAGDDDHDVEALTSVVTRTISDEAFAPVYQPIVRLQDRRVVAFEALTRFTDGVRPDIRFADAARIGLGLELEFTTLAGALSSSDQLPAGAALHLNVSPDALVCGALPGLVASSSRPLVLEVTEHDRIVDYGAVADAIDELGDGVRLAVDDAGAGYASMTHILALHPAEVKLDLALVRNVDVDVARHALVAGLVVFAAASETTLIAEGIEREGEAAALAALGVGYGQGYHLGRPALAPGR